MRAERAQRRSGAAGEVDDGRGLLIGESGGHRGHDVAVARGEIIGLAQRQPLGLEAHVTASRTEAKTCADCGHAGSWAAAGRACAARRWRASRLATTRRNAAASAAQSSGGTRMPAPGGTVSGIAPAVVAMTGNP